MPHILSIPRASVAFAFFSTLAHKSRSSYALAQSCRSSLLNSRVCPTSHPFSSRTRVCFPSMTATTPSVEAAQAPPEISGPSWVLEYEGLDAPALLSDIAAAEDQISSLEAVAPTIADLLQEASNLTVLRAKETHAIDTLASMTKAYWKAAILLRNVATQASCVASVDGSNPAAKKMLADMRVRLSRLSQAYEPASLMLDLCPDPVLEEFLQTDDEISASKYMLRHSRRMRQHKLSLVEENIITGLGVNGHSAWGTLYTDLSSTIPVRMTMPDGSVRTMGVASADAMRDSPDEALRKASWEAIREAWLPHRETCAAALNAITGWRLDLYAKRGYPSFLTSSLHMNRMSDATLDALLEAVDGSSVVGRRALQLQAKALGKDALAPWDLFAPAPVNKNVGRSYTFEEGIELIADAVSEVDKEAGDFVRMMRDKKWIEASRGDKKRPGAYCTGFAKTRTPRVYLSDYNGGAQLLLTLAHELGHAFHSWQMRDLPLAQLSYPMNLAETASIFFETVVGNKLLEQAQSAEERFSMLWADAESAATFLLNIPSRFRFEEELNKRRGNGTLSSEELHEMMERAWTKYYGDALSDLDRIGVFSQSKLHFYLTGISFYNWPYTFGYLFALGVYAEYQNGKHVKFAELYRDLLRDTGRMDAEDVVEKHLGGRIDNAAFWKKAIGVAEEKVEELSKVAAEIGKA